MGQSDITVLLDAVRSGADDAPKRLIEAVYNELHQMAQGKMRAARQDHTLQPTALVNEAYLRLVGNQHQLEDRNHFFGAAAKAMERVLVDYARQKQAQKRGGGAVALTLHDIHEQSTEPDLGVIEIHEALADLERESPDLAALVRYRYFVGLTLEQIAEITNMSLATVKRRWTFTRAWLYDRLEG